MKVTFSKVSHNEVCTTRKNALQTYTNEKFSLGYLKEKAVKSLGSFFLLLIWIFTFYIYLTYCNKFTVDKICSFLTLNSGSKGLVFLIAELLFGVISFKLIFSILRKPFDKSKTPISNKVSHCYSFYEESEHIETITRLMNKLQELSEEDLAYSEIILDGNSIEFYIKDSKHGFTEKQRYTVKNDDVIKTLRETGTLDFSCLDDEWLGLKKEHHIHEDIDEN